jgi:hypothetical protein
MALARAGHGAIQRVSGLLKATTRGSNMNYQVTAVAPSTGGYGFNITDSRSRPLVHFEFEQEDKATEAQRIIGPAQTYRGYAKETFDRALSATRRRYAHRLANETATIVQNERQIGVQNEAEEQKASDVK